MVIFDKKKVQVTLRVCSKNRQRLHRYKLISCLCILGYKFSININKSWYLSIFEYVSAVVNYSMRKTSYFVWYMPHTFRENYVNLIEISQIPVKQIATKTFSQNAESEINYFYTADYPSRIQTYSRWMIFPTLLPEI